MLTVTSVASGRVQEGFCCGVGVFIYLTAVLIDLRSSDWRGSRFSRRMHTTSHGELPLLVEIDEIFSSQIKKSRTAYFCFGGSWSFVGGTSRAVNTSPRLLTTRSVLPSVAIVSLSM